MAVVKPFRGWHYNSQKATIERVIAPPYDVISAEEEQMFHARDPHNIIRLILGQATPSRLRPDQAYKQAGEYLRQWTKEGVLTQPAKPAYYLYEMNYEHPFLKTKLTRLSLFAALKLEPFEQKVVFPHERTHATAKVDRAKLLRATECNFSPVFILYEDQTGTFEAVYQTAQAGPALFDFQDEHKTHHRLWVIDETAQTASLEKMFDGRRVFIADGHHRYETALAYAREKNGKGSITGANPFDYVLSAFVKFNDPGLLILPIHRLLAPLTGLDKQTFLERLKTYFVAHSVSRSALEKIEQGKMTGEFGLSFSESECYSLELKDKTIARQVMPEGKPAEWYDLQMNLISYLMFKALLKIEDNQLEKNISYTASSQEAFLKLGRGEVQAAFFLSPTTPSIIKEICESGEVMPPKSTYFYPKFSSGLVIYRHI